MIALYHINIKKWFDASSSSFVLDEPAFFAKNQLSGIVKFPWNLVVGRDESDDDATFENRLTQRIVANIERRNQSLFGDKYEHILPKIAADIPTVKYVIKQKDISTDYLQSLISNVRPKFDSAQLDKIYHFLFGECPYYLFEEEDDLTLIRLKDITIIPMDEVRNARPDIFNKTGSPSPFASLNDALKSYRKSKFPV